MVHQNFLQLLEVAPRERPNHLLLLLLQYNVVVPMAESYFFRHPNLFLKGILQESASKLKKSQILVRKRLPNN